MLSIAPEDSVSTAGSLQSRTSSNVSLTTLDTLKKYLEKKLPSLLKKRDVKAHRDFLEQTYALRRIQILENPCPVREVLESYPSLQQFVHVSTQLASSINMV